MRRNVLYLFTIMALSIALIGCKKKADEAKTSEAENASTAQVTSAKYMANPAESVIEWKGYKPTGSHIGTIMVESGVFSVNDGKIESGSFLIDMNSIKESEGSERLEGHLKSADFFEVEKYANSAFEVTGLEEVDGIMLLSGNLTMKEKKNNVTFPVTISSDGDNFTLTSDTFTIDRSKWDVKFKSKSFFSDLGDNFINDDIELKITLKAKKS
jgi:polyisoprenoid-binding protein YceI